MGRAEGATAGTRLLPALRPGAAGWGLLGLVLCLTSLAEAGKPYRQVLFTLRITIEDSQPPIKPV